MNSQYAIYLRKSRADVEAEARGEGETLARHRTALWALAERRGLNVVREYAELVTGDSIAARPQMQALLDDVKRGLYDGVIVNDVDRLGRGDSIDQEIIKYTFISGHCIIITPARDINPASPSDEDMLDFSLFMARFEYRKIAQRLTVGRTRSAQAGNYIATRPPYGYKRSSENHLKLELDESKADIVRMIYNMYMSGDYGVLTIAKKLNEMGIRSATDSEWSRGSVKNILRNKAYIGCTIWARKVTVNTIENGIRQKKRIDAEPIIVENTHPAIIDKETFDVIQNRFESNMFPPSVNRSKELVNPLAGLVFCSVCGKPIINRGWRGKSKDELMLSCVTPGCTTSSTRVSVVIEQLIEILNGWCALYEPIMPSKPKSKPNNALIEKEDQISAQIIKAQELVETGIYTPSEYLNRKKILEEQLNAVHNAMKAEKTTMEEAMPIMVPRIKNVLEALNYAETPREQNALLKTIVARIDYSRPGRGQNNKNGTIKLVVYPKIGGACTM